MGASKTAIGAAPAIAPRLAFDWLDASHDALESMDKGELNNTVFRDPVAQGEEAVNAAYLMVKKEPNPKVVDGIIWIPFQPVTKEKDKSFLKSGYRWKQAGRDCFDWRFAELDDLGAGTRNR